MAANPKQPSFNIIYDTETSGLDDDAQIMQIALCKTDPQYNVVDEVKWHAKLRPDVVPDPIAFLVHGIKPSELYRSGMTEFEMATRIKRYLMDANGAHQHVIMGYNNISFDDEKLRSAFYRNLMDPYDHEWRGGNRRADVYNLVNLAWAFSPETLKWRRKESGMPSMKLVDMSAANGIQHIGAHDAGSDVRATLELARAVRDGNPGLHNYWRDTLSNKKQLLSSQMLQSGNPFWCISHAFANRPHMAAVGCTVVTDANVPNKYLCVDLTQDPAELLAYGAQELAEHMFKPYGERGVNDPAPRCFSVSPNRQPCILMMRENDFRTGANFISDSHEQKMLQNVDIDECRRRAEFASNSVELKALLRDVFDASKRYPPKWNGLYDDGFIADADAEARAALRRRPRGPGGKEVLFDQPIAKTVGFRDAGRHFLMSVSAKWNNESDLIRKGDQHPGFSAYELVTWASDLKRRLFGREEDAGLEDKSMTLADFDTKMVEAKINAVTGRDHDILQDLAQHRQRMEGYYKRVTDLASRHKMAALDALNRNPVLNKIHQARRSRHDRIAKGRMEFARRQQAADSGQDAEPDLEQDDGYDGP